MRDDHANARVRAWIVMSVGVISLLLMASAYWFHLKHGHDRHPWRCIVFGVGCASDSEKAANTPANGPASCCSPGGQGRAHSGL